jgi:class 3 adenylate cyclase
VRVTASPLEGGPGRPGGQQAKRSKVDIYAGILEVVRRYPGGGRITRISYGVGVPIDRLRGMIQELSDFGLIRADLVDDETRYLVSQRGLEFLETYWKMNGFLEAFKEAPTRGLAAIMFTDMVGYTAVAQRDEKLALKLLAEQQTVIRSQLPRYHGREVKTMGDAFLVEFSSALDASLCAVDIQKEMARRNASSPRGSQVQLRIGIHVGDVERNGKDIVGDSVNLASRIQTASDPGGVCISRQVFDQIWNKLGHHVTQVGFREMKNVMGEVEVFRIDLPEIAQAK